MEHPEIAIVPAGGRALRLPLSLRPKELLPLNVRPSNIQPPGVLSEYLFEALRVSGVKRVCVIVGPEKPEIARFYGCGERHGVEIEYVCQPVARGMADAIDAAYRIARDSTILVGMPDTIFQPIDAFGALRALVVDERVDVALAVFPTGEAHRLGPVLVDDRGIVHRVLDKPDIPPVANTWGLACWGPRFTELLHEHTRRWSCDIDAGELALGMVFQRAVSTGMCVRAVSFPDGMYIDVGTPDGLCAARRFFADRVSWPERR
jgi:glucose-1-phosphate thymidylyltransferase